MAAHATRDPRWWERHDMLMWTVATTVERWQWLVGLALLTLFALTGGAGADR